MKIYKPKSLREKIGVRGGHTTEVIDILPYLPPSMLFFDCRHFVYGTDVIPFALSTRSFANNQQYLKQIVEYELR